MKKIICLLITLSCLLTLVACTGDEPDDVQSEKDYLLMNEPDIDKLGLLSSEFSDVLDFSMETDYTAVGASVDKSVYSIDFETISVNIVDSNPGKAFWLFSVPFLKHQKEDETVLIPFNKKLQLDAYGERDLWGICGIADKFRIHFFC